MNTSTQTKTIGEVYHIQNPANPSIDEGYIGVVKKTKGSYKRFREHSACRGRIMHHHIRTNNVTEDHVKVLFVGDIQDCYDFEKTLRPKQLMGWNIASGGGGPYYSTIDDLSKMRSESQSARMQDEALKKRQSDTFKENYYSNSTAQELRSKRAKEHMADPEKKKKCLSGMHKKIVCPYCKFETNAGNMKRHINAKHPEQNDEK
jgi:hypothetical protein